MRLDRWTLVVVASAVSGAAALAQPTPDAAAYAALAKLPEIAGLWEMTFGGGPRGAPPEGPSFTPAYAAKLKSYQEAQARGEIQDSPAANCVPPGMPGVMTQPYPIDVLVTPGKITIIAEAYAQWRQIFTDGRKHPDDPDLTYNGHSIGHWEGDTLVVDTVGFTTDTALGGFGMRHSDKMHIVERIQARSTRPARDSNVDHRPGSVDEAVEQHARLRPAPRLDAGRVRVSAEQPQFHDR